MRLARISLLLVLTAPAEATLELTDANWNDAVKGKNAFIKFLAPW